MKSKFTLLAVFVALTLFSSKLFSQPLSGTYTIGGTSPDFATITGAVDTLSSNGITGPVIFNIRSGTYYENVTIDTVPGNGLYSITFESEMGDSSSVILIDTGTSLYNEYSIFTLENCIITFYQLTFLNQSLYSDECINSYGAAVVAKHCLFEATSSYQGNNNYLITLGSNYDLIDSCSFIVPNFSIYGESQYLILNHCTLNSPFYFLSGGTFFFENNYFDSTFQYSWAGDVDSFIFQNNIIKSGLQFVRYNSLSSINDTYSGELDFIGGNAVDFFKNDLFLSALSLQDSEAILENNNFDGVVVEGTDCKLYSNYFVNAQSEIVYDLTCEIDSNNGYGDLEIDYLNQVEVNSNNLYGGLTIDYADLCTINKNSIDTLMCTFNGVNTITRNKINVLWVDYSSGTTDVFNNEILNGLEFSYDAGINFYHNNVLENANGNLGFVFGGDHVNIKNNNFNGGFYSQYTNINSDYNNYFPYDSTTEPHSISIDPQYISTTNLTTQNPLLIGKGEDLLPFVPIDIDSFPRHIHPTIGANELCFTDAEVNLRTINIPCGDSVMLTQCDYNGGYTYSWEPATGLSNSSIYNPILSVTNSGTYICTIKSGNTLIERDSVSVNITPFNVTAYEDTSIQYCGYGLNLNATYNSSATYQWTPSTGLNNPDIQSPFANPSVTTTYTVTATVPGCGTSTSSVVITVNPFPIAYAYLDSQYHNWIRFLNGSTCANNYLWSFCDGTTDTATNPIHIFPDTGYCLVTLVACNSYGCDTFSAYVYIDSIKIAGIANPLSNTNSLQVFPNPANDVLNILLSKTAIESEVQIEVLDMLGQCHYNEDFNSYNGSFQQKIDLSNLAKGIYIVKVKAGEDNYYRKVILQ